MLGQVSWALRALVLSMLVGAVAVLLDAPAASAEEQPAILKAYDLDWIERVREDAWPQPKAQRPVICLLDTGVDITPDTPADHPEGPIVARLALDGGSGLAQGTSWEHQHGTQMASIIAAPRNNYGTVGVFPQARIVSIRVTDKTQEEVYITPGLMARGVRACKGYAEAAGVRVGSVVMAESNYSQRTIDRAFWEEAATATRQLGGLMVAAVGNDVTATTVPPVGIPEVVPIFAADGGGKRCAFSPVLEEPTLVGLPGCDSDPWPAGSSQAAALAGALLTAYIARSPSVEAVDALSALAGSPSFGPRVLRGTAWRAAMAPHLDDVLPQAAVVPTPAPGMRTLPPVSAPATRLWRPSVRARWRRGALVVTRTDSKGGVLRVRVSSSEFVVSGRKFSKRLKRRPRRVEAWAVGRNGSWRSLTTFTRVVV